MTDTPPHHSVSVRHSGKLQPCMRVDAQEEVLDSLCLRLGQVKVRLVDLGARVGLVDFTLLLDLKDVRKAIRL